MPMYNLIEYSNNFLKTSGSLFQYCKEIPAIDNDGNITDSNGANATDSADNNNDGNIARRVDVEIIFPLKYLSNF